MNHKVKMSSRFFFGREMFRRHQVFIFSDVVTGHFLLNSNFKNFAYLTLREHKINEFLISTMVKEGFLLLYSLVITAKLNDKDPFKVMTEILSQLPCAKSIDDYEKLARLLIKSV